MTVWIVSSSLLIVLVIALRQILKGRLSPRIQYALWLLVLLRLLIPGTFAESPVSIQNAIPAEVRSLPVFFTASSVSEGADVSSPAAAEPRESGPEAPVPAAVSAAPTLETADLLRLLWLGGAAALLLTAAASNLRFSLRLHRSRTPRTDIESTLPVYTVPWLAAPCLVGLFRPAIYLCEDLEGEALRHVLTHEQTHLRHGDPLWSRLRLLALALHWYNPLVWAAALLSKRDAELACDESTLLRLGSEARRSYGETLLRLSCPRIGHLLDLSTAMTDSKRSLVERIRFIAQRPRTALTSLLLVLFLSAFAVTSAFTGAAAASERYTDKLQSSDGTVTAALDLTRDEKLFPDGAPVIRLAPHEITPDEMHRIVTAVFGADTPVWQDQEENLSEKPVATQETLDRWLMLADDLRAGDFYEKVSAGDENVLRHRIKELDDFIAYCGDPAFYVSMPRDADRLPMVWDNSLRPCLAEKNGISYRIAVTPRPLHESTLYTLNISPEDARPAALYSYVLHRYFGGQEVSDRQWEAARGQAETLAKRMGLPDWSISECRIMSFPFPSYESSGSSRDLILVVLDRRYDPRLPLQHSTNALSFENALSLELSADGRLIDLHWSWPYDAVETREAAALLSWKEIVASIEAYVDQLSVEDFGFAGFVAGEEPRMPHGITAELDLVSLRPGLSYAEETPGTGDWQLIPSVAVYGDVTLRDEGGEALLSEGMTFADLHDPEWPLFVLSALDGSLIEDLHTPPALG